MPNIKCSALAHRPAVDGLHGATRQSNTDFDLGITEPRLLQKYPL